MTCNLFNDTDGKYIYICIYIYIRDNDSWHVTYLMILIYHCILYNIIYTYTIGLLLESRHVFNCCMACEDWKQLKDIATSSMAKIQARPANRMNFFAHFSHGWAKIMNPKKYGLVCSEGPLVPAILTNFDICHYRFLFRKSQTWNLAALSPRYGWTWSDMFFLQTYCQDLMFQKFPVEDPWVQTLRSLRSFDLLIEPNFPT